jgi:hypothetical protein
MRSQLFDEGREFQSTGFPVPEEDDHGSISAILRSPRRERPEDKVENECPGAGVSAAALESASKRWTANTGSMTGKRGAGKGGGGKGRLAGFTGNMELVD